MTDRHFSQDPQFDADETRGLTALGFAARRTAGCPDPALVLALEEGVLDVDVAARVRLHVSSCPACRIAAGDLANVFDEEISADTRRRLDARVATARRKPARGVWYWLVPAGGLTLLTAGLVLFFFRTPEPPALPATQLTKDLTSPLPTVFTIDRPAIPPGEIDLTVRGAKTPADVANQAALALDRADGGDVSGGLAEAQALLAKHPESRKAGLAVGALLLRMDRNAEAVAVLEPARLLKTDPGVNDEVDWFLSIARVRIGDRANAKALLEAICKRGGARSTRACAGVAELDRLPSAR